MSADQVIDECTSVPTLDDLRAKREVSDNSHWKPISHSHAVETIFEAFDKHEIKVLDSAFALNKSGHTIVGGFEVVGDCLPEKTVDGNYQMFLRHANDMSVSMQLNAGMNLFVCTNGMMTGDKLASHKHTVNFDFDKWIVDETLPAFINKLGAVNHSIAEMRDYEMADGEAYNLILEAADKRLLPYARAIDVYREWNEPTFADDDFQKNTMWKLYNDCTYIAQRCKPERHHAIVNEMHGFLTAAM